MEKYINPFTDFGFAYEDSLKYYRDVKNSLDTAFEEGKYQKAIETAEKLLKKGFGVEEVAEITELPIEEVKMRVKG